MKKRFYYVEAKNKVSKTRRFIGIGEGFTENRRLALSQNKKYVIDNFKEFEEDTAENLFDMYTYKVKCEWIETDERRYELQPKYDLAQSFYKKAFVERTLTGFKLLSYDTNVCEISDNTVFLKDKWDYSPTTLRHVKEFLKQYGFSADSKKQIEQLYW